MSQPTTPATTWPITYGSSQAAAAELLQASPATIGRAVRRLGISSAETPKEHYLSPQQIMQINAELKRRVPSELAGQLIDDAYARDIGYGDEIASMLDEWINPEAPSTFELEVANTSQDLESTIEGMRSKLSPEEFRTVELLYATAASGSVLPMSAIGITSDDPEEWQPIEDDQPAS